LLGKREDALLDRERPDLPDVHAELVHRDRADRSVVALEARPALRDLLAVALQLVGLVRHAGRLDAHLGYEELVVHGWARGIGPLAPGALDELLDEGLHARCRALVPGIRRGVPALDGVTAERDEIGRGGGDAALNRPLEALTTRFLGDQRSLARPRAEEQHVGLLGE